VFYGATGFTGRQAARYLTAHAPAGLRVAVAGRRLLATLAADGDPANRVTVTALGEAALTLATARDTLPGAGSRAGASSPRRRRSGCRCSSG
jgi:short subunit dehydrogenase-like uncharacterized protein